MLDLSEEFVFDRHSPLYGGMWRVPVRCRPTEGQFRREVDRLRSVSEAGKVWIVDERCKYASLGKYQNTFHFKPKRTPY